MFLRESFAGRDFDNIVSIHICGRSWFSRCGDFSPLTLCALLVTQQISLIFDISAAWHDFFSPIVRASSHSEKGVLCKCLLFVWIDIQEVRFYRFSRSVCHLFGGLSELTFFACSCWQMAACLLVIITFTCKMFPSSCFLFPVPAFCQEDELKCANHECVSRDGWCDGKADCLDSSDEWDCGELLASAICCTLGYMNPK